MAKTAKKQDLVHDHGRGEIRDNALAALVTSKLFRCKSEKTKKGRGSFTRKVKYKGKEPYQSAFTMYFDKALFSLIQHQQIC